MVDGCGRWPCLFFFLSDSRIVSHSPFAYNWKNKFWDSKPIVACFPSNKGGNLDIRIPRNFSELYPTSCMRDVCRVRGLGSSCMLKQNILSLILLILLAKLTNQKMVVLLILLVKLTNQKMVFCRHRILYPLRLGPSFPNDAQIPRSKVGLGPNQMLN